MHSNVFPGAYLEIQQFLRIRIVLSFFPADFPCLALVDFIADENEMRLS